MSTNRVMIIGGIGAGKSTLTKALLNKSEVAVKTQTLQFEDWIVDTPGEYIENPLFYKNIMATALDVTHVIYLHDATRNFSHFPPHFSSGIPKLQIGVITKSDHPNADVALAKQLLKQVLVQGPIVETSALQHSGLHHIHALVQCNSLEEMRHYVEQAKDVFIEMI